MNTAFFDRAVLNQADLSRADLRRAFMFGCQAQAAVFDRADLSAADLSWAAVRKASFAGARLVEANLHLIDDLDAVWTRGNRTKARGTDPILAQAESWQPQY